MGLLTVQEQHIAVRDGLQKGSSAQVENFYDEEIDYHLNKAQDVFVDHLTSDSFSNPIIRNQYFQNLIVRNRELGAAIPQSLDLFYEENMVYGILPADYLYHLGSRAAVLDICNDDDPPGTISSSFDKILITFPKSVKGSGPYYVSSRLQIGPDAYISKASSGYVSPDEYFEVVSELLTLVNREGKYNLYWEQFNGQQYPGQLIITSGSVTLTTAIYQSPNTYLTTYYGTVPSEDRQIFGSYMPGTRYNYNLDGTDTANLVWSPTMPKELDDVYLNNTNNFFKSKKSNPYATIANGKLQVFQPEKSIIASLRMDYIRRPARISLALNSACELSGNASRRIVDLAVEWMKLITENPTVQAHQQEQQLRENH